MVLGGIEHHRCTGEKCVKGLGIEDVNLDSLEPMLACDRLGPLQVEVAYGNLVGPIPCGQIAGDDPPDDPGTEQRDPASRNGVGQRLVEGLQGQLHVLVGVGGTDEPRLQGVRAGHHPTVDEPGADLLVASARRG